MEVHVHANTEDAIKAASMRVSKILEATSGAVLLLVSGGSALHVLDEIDFQFINARVTLGVLDERLSESNYKQLQATDFFTHALQRGAQSISTVSAEYKTPERLASYMNDAWKDWVSKNPNGKIIITQGMGPDGHTAGIMPYPQNPQRFAELFETDNLVVGYDAGGKNEYPLRATASLSFLRTVDYSVLFETGIDKCVAYHKVMMETGSLHQAPARIIHEMKDVSVFTDVDCATHMKYDY